MIFFCMIEVFSNFWEIVYVEKNCFDVFVRFEWLLVVDDMVL